MIDRHGLRMHENRLLMIKKGGRTANLKRCLPSAARLTTCSASGPSGITESYLTWCSELTDVEILMPQGDGVEVLPFVRERSREVRVLLRSGSNPLARKMAESRAPIISFTIDTHRLQPFKVADVCAIPARARSSLDKKQKTLGQDYGNHQ